LHELLLRITFEVQHRCILVDTLLDNFWNLQVYKARRVATMKMLDDGFEEQVKDRKKQKLKTLAAKGLLKKTRKRKKSKQS